MAKKKKGKVYKGQTHSKDEDRTPDSRKEKREKDTKKDTKKSKQTLCPPDEGIAIQDPYVQGLLNEDPLTLIDYEENFLDQRMASGEAYTQGGSPTYFDPHLIPVGIFDPATAPSDSSWAVFGRRRSGKSYFTRDLMYAYHQFLDHGLIMTKTRHNHFFQVVPPETVPKKYKDDYQGGFIPDQAVLQDFDRHIVRKFMDFQLELIKNEDEYKRQGYERPGFLWLDDVVDAKVIMTEGDHGCLAQLFQQGRHFDIMVGINTQYPRSIPTKMRDNVDFAVIFKQDSNTEFEALIDHYMGELNRRTARELIYMYTRGQFNGPKQCLIVNMQSGCPWELKYQTYVANPEPPSFVVGGKQFKKDMEYQPEGGVFAPFM